MWHSLVECASVDHRAGPCGSTRVPIIWHRSSSGCVATTDCSPGIHSGVSARSRRMITEGRRIAKSATYMAHCGQFSAPWDGVELPHIRHSRTLWLPGCGQLVFGWRVAAPEVVGKIAPLPPHHITYHPAESCKQALKPWALKDAIQNLNSYVVYAYIA